MVLVALVTMVIIAPLVLQLLLHNAPLVLLTLTGQVQFVLPVVILNILRLDQLKQLPPLLASLVMIATVSHATEPDSSNALDALLTTI